MNILLIYPSKLDDSGNPIKYRKAFLPPLSLAILNALTPAQHKVKVINDFVEDIDFSKLYDLVGITVMTSQAMRAYQIADCFRKLGTKVVIGGIHATILPDEAKKHANSVVIGEAENIWETVLRDAARNRLKDFYQDSSLPNLQKLIIPKWNAMNLDIYSKPMGHKLPMMPIFTTRGCPFGCKFCSVTKYFGKTYRVKPISHVIKEIESVNAETVFFVDDNIAFNVDYARQLFKALSRKKIRWFSQASTTILKSPDLINLAGQSGCFGLFLGIESIKKENLKAVGKWFNKRQHYGKLFSQLRKAGINPFPSVIFGLDNDNEEMFKETLDFLHKNKVNQAAFFLLTPLPGTKVFEEMDSVGRILHRDWSAYDLNHVVFEPKNFTRTQLLTKYWETYREFYSVRNIAKGSLYKALHSANSFRSVLHYLFYGGLFRKAINSYDHPFSGGVGRIKN